MPTVVTKTLIDRQYVESLRPLTIASSGHPIDLLYIYIYIAVSIRPDYNALRLDETKDIYC